MHVAGSKGKATTSTHIANILTAAGFRTGLFTSPHLHTWRERISRDGRQISERSFAAIGETVLQTVRELEGESDANIRFTAFDILLAMALGEFRMRSCQFAVLEVGLGGRYDATNVVLPDVAVITELEIEHAKILGASLSSIAWNKGGIIKPGVPVVALRPPEEAIRVLDGIAASHAAPMLMEDREWKWSTSRTGVTVSMPGRVVEHLTPASPGDHQRQNAALAAVAVSQLTGESLPPHDDAIRSGISRTRLPGHFETVRQGDRTVVLDVAHTPRSIDLLLAALAEAGYARPEVVAGFLNDKEILQIVTSLAGIARFVTLVPVRSPRSATMEQLAAAATHFPNVRVVSQMDDRYAPVRTQHPESDSLLVTGSSALVAEVRERLGLPTR